MPKMSDTMTDGVIAAWHKKVGDKAIFARNGGRSIFNLYMHNSDRAKLLADIRRVEQLVKIKIK